MSNHENLLELITDDLPLTPYRGTGGFVNRDTSRERAEHEVKSGKLAERQEAVLRILRQVGLVGATWRELGRELNLHHGQISGILSILHKEGRVFMLRHKRDGSHPYCHTGIRGHFKAEQIYVKPVKTTKNQYRDDFLILSAAIQRCLEDGFTPGSREALREAFYRTSGFNG